MACGWVRSSRPSRRKKQGAGRSPRNFSPEEGAFGGGRRTAGQSHAWEGPGAQRG